MIQINEKYFIDADKLNIILKERVIMTQEKYDKLSDKQREKTKVGNETITDLGYFPNVESALQKLLEKHKKDLIEKNEYASIEDAIKELKYMQEDFRKQVKSLNVPISVYNKCTGIELDK
jgi:3-hydroxy-3-methylglutaryl CoA synthase